MGRGKKALCQCIVSYIAYSIKPYNIRSSMYKMMILFHIILPWTFFKVPDGRHLGTIELMSSLVLSPCDTMNPSLGKIKAACG